VSTTTSVSRYKQYSRRPITDQSLIPSVAQTLTQLFLEPVNSLEAACAIVVSAKESAQGRGGDLGGSENLRAEPEAPEPKEVVARFLTNLAKVCALFGLASGALKRLPAVYYGKQLIENMLYETVNLKARRSYLHIVLTWFSRKSC
jgi:hypothetical protein